jgi:hypothetical protein
MKNIKEIKEEKIPQPKHLKHLDPLGRENYLHCL